MVIPYAYSNHGFDLPLECAPGHGHFDAEIEKGTTLSHFPSLVLSSEPTSKGMMSFPISRRKISYALKTCLDSSN